ncbi:MAG: outer membrane beta-barrel protein [Ignavibacteriales bacterium]|nr:outer membrane beta-barrel protein [Ignavibacteriales bacterium]
MKFIFKIISIYFVIVASILAQANEKKFGVSFNVNYTSTSKLYLQPNATDPFIRDTHNNLDKITSYSIDLRYQISESIIMGAGSELIQKTFDSFMNLGGTRAKMKDGYKMIPIEFSVFYLIPFSTEKFKFFMGGGFGIYIGQQIREIGNVTISNESKKIGYGIHVAIGLDYVINEFFSIRGQFRSRDPEIEMTSKYSNPVVNYNDAEYTFPSQTFSSKVNIDGITFTLGAVINF